MLDFVGRVRGHLSNDLLQRKPDGHHFAGDVQFVLCGAVHAADVEVGGYGIGNKSRLHHGNGQRPFEAASAGAGIEVDAALAAFDEGFTGAEGGRILLVTEAGVHVSIDVAGAQLYRQQIVKWASRAIGTEVDHDGNVCFGAGDDGLLDGGPLRTTEVCGLDADDSLRIFERHLCGSLSVHVLHILLVFVAAHARADDVEQCKNPGF